MKLSGVIFLVAVAAVADAVAAQERPPVSWRATAKTAVFIEILGNGGLVTYNVDRKLNQRITARVAYGNYNTLTAFSDQEPIRYRTYTGMLNTLAGGPTWWLEAGAGVMLGSRWAHPRRPLSEVTSVVGVRRQPLRGGVVLRAGIVPRYVIHGQRPPANRTVVFRGGASLGLAF